MTASLLDSIIVSVAFTAVCVWLMGKALNWVLKQAEKKGQSQSAKWVRSQSPEKKNGFRL